MKRIFIKYTEWEDWKAGQYSTSMDNYDELFLKAKDILSCPVTLKKWMTDVIITWPISSKVNLTNTSINRQAWLGQAACCFAVSANENITKSAWWSLTEVQKVDANKVADAIIKTFEMSYNGQSSLL